MVSSAFVGIRDFDCQESIYSNSSDPKRPVIPPKFISYNGAGPGSQDDENGRKD